MQVNLIAQLTAAAPAPLPQAASPDASEEGQHHFAKLLSDADAKNGSEQQGSKHSVKQQDTSKTAISAQEVDQPRPAQSSPAAEKITKTLETEVGPDEAKAMLAKLAAMEQAGDEHANNPAFKQLREALEKIQATGTPMKVSEILQQLPAVVEAAVTDAVPVLQKLVGWVANALSKDKESSLQADAGADAATQSLQASLFSAGDDAAARAAAQAQADADARKGKDAQEATVTVIVPTAQPATMPAWVSKLGAGEETNAADAINQAIPPLTADIGDDALPSIHLPDAKGLAGELFGAKEGDDKKAAGAAKFHDLLAGLPQHSNDNSDEAPAPVVVDANGSVLVASNSPSVHNTSTLNPITLSASSHLMPHIAAQEQVHVAITSMKKDGIDSLTLQLEPADLGRVEIKMETINGTTHLSFLVDKPDTLDALARDVRSLERQLQDAGVRADAGSMQFNLRQQPQGHESSEDDKRSRTKGGVESIDAAAAAEVAPVKHYTLNVRDGVDIEA